MNPDDEYQSWLNARRAESPPTDLSDRIMTIVRESSSLPTKAAMALAVQKTALQRAVPFFVCSAAALVLAVRLYSFVSVFFVVASSDTEIAMTEPVEEVSDVNKP